MTHRMQQYYSDRVEEYEEIYRKPERQEDLQTLKALLKPEVAGKHVLEIACGTGYWTRHLSGSAKWITAIDLNAEMLAEARRFPLKNVDFQRHDIYTLDQLPGTYDCILGGFIWSHIPLEKIDRFLDQMRSKTTHETPIIFWDNRYIPGNSTPITYTDAKGNTFQNRSLNDGRTYTILKNYPDPAWIEAHLSSYTVEFTQLDYFWVMKCQYR